jgi:uncharacterized protein YjbJ (UPF0337 family)
MVHPCAGWDGPIERAGGVAMIAETAARVSAVTGMKHRCDRAIRPIRRHRDGPHGANRYPIPPVAPAWRVTSRASRRKETCMNQDQAKGGMKEAAGKVQKAAGDLTDNGTQKAKGMAHEAEGKVQKKVGDVKENLQDNDRNKQ